MKQDFSTVDITKHTPKTRIKSIVKESARPGKMCEMAPGYIHPDEHEAIANELGVSKEQLIEHFLREVKAYNSTLHKPKHHPNERHTGMKRTDAVAKMPYGPCIFLDKSKEGHVCSLGKAMPFHCQIATNHQVSEKLHSWYLLNHAVDPNDPMSVREWATYLKTHPTVPGGELHELVPDKEKRDAILKGLENKDKSKMY